MLRFAGPLAGLFCCLLAGPVAARGDVHALVTQAAHRHGVPVSLALAVARKESGIRCSAKNPRSTATGVYQLIRSTARELGVNPHDCAQNIDGGVRYLAKSVRKGGSLCQIAARHERGLGFRGGCTNYGRHVVRLASR